MAKPILKWAGGKRQILHEIRSCFPRSGYEAYHEPFFGGGAVFFELSPDNGTINDINPRLVNFYKQVRDNPEGLIKQCRNYQGRNTEEEYYKFRDRFNKLREHGVLSNPLEEAALLLYLNRTCYNGLYRENSSGEFNVPFGDQPEDVDVVREKRIKEVSNSLQGTEIYKKNFSYVENEAESGDLVYFDPPYKPVSKTANFAEYTADGFDHDDQKELRNVAIRLAKEKVHVVISNSPPAETLYDSDEEDKVPENMFYIRPVDARRSINRNGDDRTGATEILITTVPPDEWQGTLGAYTQSE